jgi:NADH dehydrogenase (ubiquinone) 1 alpha subcomplex subunit 9
MDLQTKFYGEQEVRNICPSATIFRPATVYGTNDYLIRLWHTQRGYFYNFNVVTDDCQAKRQPILVNDLAQCVLNALKLNETAGRTYEIGIC